jgi:hypothetical protein
MEIKRLNHQLLMKKSCNSDDHQFYQYQQNEQSALILTELTELKKITPFYFGLGQAQKCSGAKLVNGIPIAPLDNWISNSNTIYMYKQAIKKPAQIINN